MTPEQAAELNVRVDADIEAAAASLAGDDDTVRLPNVRVWPVEAVEGWVIGVATAVAALISPGVGDLRLHPVHGEPDQNNPYFVASLMVTAASRSEHQLVRELIPDTPDNQSRVMVALLDLAARLTNTRRATNNPAF